MIKHHITGGPNMDKIQQQMLLNMELRGFSKNTISNYLRGVRQFLNYFYRFLLEIRIDNINQYQYHLRNTIGHLWSSFNIHVCAIRFLYNVTLRQKTIQLLRQQTLSKVRSANMRKMAEWTHAGSAAGVIFSCGVHCAARAE